MATQSDCICQKSAYFVPKIQYSDSVFANYQGITIGQCIRCGVYKTIHKNKNFNTQNTLSDLYESKTLQFENLFKPLVQSICDFVDKGIILDIGCSTGILLGMLRRKGFKVYGIEPNRSAYRLGKKKLGKTIFNGTTKEFVKKCNTKFDVVIYNHVLEHIEDVNNEFTHIHKLLAPQGILIIGVPNTNNVLFTLRSKYWESLRPLEHVWHFSNKYLVSYLQKKHFKILKIQYYNHNRLDYPVLKRIYFNSLIFFNKLLRTGESMVIYASLR